MKIISRLAELLNVTAITSLSERELELCDERSLVLALASGIKSVDPVQYEGCVISTEYYGPDIKTVTIQSMTSNSKIGIHIYSGPLSRECEILVNARNSFLRDIKELSIPLHTLVSIYSYRDIDLTERTFIKESEEGNFQCFTVRECLDGEYRIKQVNAEDKYTFKVLEYGGKTTIACPTNWADDEVGIEYLLETLSKISNKVENKTSLMAAVGLCYCNNR